MKKLLKAPEGSAQQGFHLVSFGQDENLVIICCAICFQCLIFAFERWEIYSFFGGGEKGEGKSSFADVGFGDGLAVCKCAFSFAVGF